MAYPLKQYTSTEYGFLSPDVYDYISYDKIYLMPEITDGTAEWTINLYEPDETPILELNDYNIEPGYRVLFSSNFYPGDQQLYVVVTSGTDPISGKPWINANMVGNAADIPLRELPIGTQIYWTIVTFFAIMRKTAKTDGDYLDPVTGAYIGTYLDFAPFPVSLPSGNVRAESVFVTNQRVTIVITDTNNQVVLNESYDPSDHGINRFLIRNRVVIT